jgi:hypothetical protein
VFRLQHCHTLNRFCLPYRGYSFYYIICNCKLKLARYSQTKLFISIKGDNVSTLQLSRTAAIQQRLTAVLRSIPKEAFADSFQKLYERYQPCVVKDGDYFEGK